MIKHMAVVLSFSDARVKAVDLAVMLPYLRFHTNRVFLNEPNEHYRLLSALAAQLPAGSVAVDTRTHLGSTALALAHGMSAVADGRVVSYFSEDEIARHTTDIVGADLSDVPTAKTHPGIEVRRVAPDAIEIDELLKASLIVVEPDARSLTYVTSIVRALEAGGYKGILVMDAIRLSKDMNDLWTGVKAPKKMDASSVGHWSGTGIAAFDPSFINVEN